MKVRIKRIDGLYLQRGGFWTDKKNVALIDIKNAKRVCERYAGLDIETTVEPVKKVRQVER